MIELYINKRKDALNLGCTLPGLVNIRLHESTRLNFYPFNQTDTGLLKK